MQAATVFPSFGALLLLLFGGGPLDLPVSLPPLPEDPAMAAAAPAECMWYLSWSGVAKPDPASKNQTEQLLAEEEIQKFVSTVEKQLMAAIAKQPTANPQQVAAIEQLPKLAKTLLTRPMAVFVSRFEMGPAGPVIEGGLLVNTGDQTQETIKSLETLTTAMLGQQAVADGKWRKLPLPAGAPEIQWGAQGKYLIVGVGHGMADQIAASGKKAPPAWLASVRKQLPVARPAMIHYVNLEKTVGLLSPMAGPQVEGVLKAAGLGNVKYVANVTGLDASGYVTKTLLASDGGPQGLLTILGGKPLAAKDLAPIPQDATVAWAMRLDADKAFHQLLAFLDNVEPGQRAARQRDIAQFEQELGVSISEDVLGSLGDTWCVYSAPSEGGLLVTGLTAVVPLRDHEKLLAAHDKLVAALRPGKETLPPGQRPTRPTIDDFKSHGQTVYFVNFHGEQSPVAPAWCLTDKELIVSLYPQVIKAHLARSPKAGSLADVPSVAAEFKGGKGPTFISYQDTATVFQTLYPLVQIGAQALCSELQRQGIDIDISALPSAAAIAPHLSPGISTLTSGKDGLVLVAHRSLPLNPDAAMLVSLPGMFLWGVARPTVSPPEASSAVLSALAPSAAGRTQSMNNLKQLGLAMHNYHDSFGKLPSATGADKSKDGKPGLSWRVHVLPFIEEQNLYQQFKLDEPWDSDNNKKLIEKMPKLFAAPGSKAAGEHKTVYLTPRGSDTVFPADEQIRLTDITDGTSNTLMIVEAGDEQAVIWTKPDDYEVNFNKPLAGLVGLRSGGFLAAFADGSVRMISEKIKPATLRALYTRKGGEVVDPNDLEQ